MNFSLNVGHLTRLTRFLLLFLVVALSNPAQANGISKKSKKKKKPALTQQVQGEFANFVQWTEVTKFIEQMVTQHGFDRAELEATMRNVRYVDSAVQLIKPAPPGFQKNWRTYHDRFIEPTRINAGVAFWDAHQDALTRAEAQYGVPAEIIVGIIGIETMYGRNVGSFRVMDAITTLAFAYPDTPTRDARMAFFRSELANTLLFARVSKIDPFSLLGSYAGAIGLPQFMPGSIRQYAVDFDGDGKIDLRNSADDAIGSIANFLLQHGWQPGAPIVFPATVAAADGEQEHTAWEGFIGQDLTAKFTLDDLKTAGVTPAVEVPPDILLGLVDLQNGQEPTEYWLGAANFFAIAQYNRSFFYAMSVIDLGRAVQSTRSR